MVPCTAPSAPYTRPTQPLSRPPPIQNSVQKTICSNSTSNAPYDGRIYPKHVELRIHKKYYLVVSSWHFTLFNLVITVSKFHFSPELSSTVMEEHILQVLQNTMSSKVVEEYETVLRAGWGVRNGTI